MKKFLSTAKSGPGFIDPVSLITLGFLIVGLVVTTTIVKNPNISLDIRNWARISTGRCPDGSFAPDGELEYCPKAKTPTKPAPAKPPAAPTQPAIQPAPAPEATRVEKNLCLAEGGTWNNNQCQYPGTPIIAQSPAQPAVTTTKPDLEPEETRFIQQEAVKKTSPSPSPSPLPPVIPDSRLEEAEARFIQQEAVKKPSPSPSLACSSTGASGLCASLTCCPGLTKVTGMYGYCQCSAAQACAPNSTRCDGTTIQETCKADGSGYDRKTCPSGCANNICKPTPAGLTAPTVQAGQKRCNATNTAVEEYKNGQWEKVQNCISYCDPQTFKCVDLSYVAQTQEVIQTQTGITPETPLGSVLEQDPMALAMLSSLPQNQAVYQETASLGDTCITYYRLQNPSTTNQEAEDRCNKERGQVLLTAAAAYGVYNLPYIVPNIVPIIVPIVSSPITIGVSSPIIASNIAFRRDVFFEEGKYAIDRLFSSENDFYILELNQTVYEKSGAIYNADTNKLLGPTTAYSGYHFIQQPETIYSPGGTTLSNIDTPGAQLFDTMFIGMERLVGQTQHTTITPTTFSSEKWSQLSQQVPPPLDNNNPSLEYLTTVTSIVNTNLTYLPALAEVYQNNPNPSAVSQNLATLSSSASYQTLENKINNQTTVCFDYAVTEYLLLASKGINSTIVSSNTLQHAFLLVSVNGTEYVVDPTWNLIMEKEAHQQWLNYNDLTHLKSPLQIYP